MKTFIRHIAENTQKYNTKIGYNMTRQYNTIFYNTVVKKYKFIYFIIAIL